MKGFKTKMPISKYRKINNTKNQDVGFQYFEKIKIHKENKNLNFFTTLSKTWAKIKNPP